MLLELNCNEDQEMGVGNWKRKIEKERESLIFSSIPFRARAAYGTVVVWKCVSSSNRTRLEPTLDLPVS